jgi:ATP-dependent Clp protease adaptor protein ClpS
MTAGTVPRVGLKLLAQIRIVMRRLAPLITPAAVGSGARATAAPGQAPVMERTRQQLPYPRCRVIVLDDDVNTYQHVVECLVRYIPGMGPDRAWELARRIDTEGQADVWSGPKEQAELYHQQLGAEGLTMAPLESI